MDRVEYAEGFDEALDILDDQCLSTSRDDMVPLRGAMVSMNGGYGLEDSEGSVYGVPEYIPCLDEVLEWGSEKGSDADFTRVAGYGKRNLHIDHCRIALESVPDRLDDWSVDEGLQSDTRPVLLAYDPELLDFGISFYAELPDNVFRDDLIQCAVVLDQDPSSDDFSI